MNMIDKNIIELNNAIEQCLEIIKKGKIFIVAKTFLISIMA